MLLLFACFLLILGKLELHKLASSIPSGFPWWFSVQQCSNHYHLGANQYNYVIADLLILASCFGSQSSSSLVTSSFLLQQCPMNHSLLIFIVSVILGWWSHMSLLVLCIFQETPRTALGILLYVPQSSSSIFQHRKSVHFQLWPKRNLLWDAFVGLISTLSSFCCMHSKLVQFLYSCPFHWIVSTNQDIWSYLFASIYSLAVWQDLLQVDCTACILFNCS